MTVKRQITTAWWNSFYIWCQYLITGLAFSNLGLERLDLLLGLLQLTHTLTRCALILRQLTLLLLNQPLRHRQITQTNTLKCLLWNILKFDATLLFWLLNEHICLKKKNCVLMWVRGHTQCWTNSYDHSLPLQLPQEVLFFHGGMPFISLFFIFT